MGGRGGGEGGRGERGGGGREGRRGAGGRGEAAKTDWRAKEGTEASLTPIRKDREIDALPRLAADGEGVQLEPVWRVCARLVVHARDGGGGRVEGDVEGRVLWWWGRWWGEGLLVREGERDGAGEEEAEHAVRWSGDEMRRL
jgi:hypothetical protein